MRIIEKEKDTNIHYTEWHKLAKSFELLADYPLTQHSIQYNLALIISMLSKQKKKF